ncbi:MAG: hypothetical protein AB1646_24810 [Thermodesulfobacteriota bacterium]
MLIVSLSGHDTPLLHYVVNEANRVWSSAVPDTAMPVTQGANCPVRSVGRQGAPDSKWHKYCRVSLASWVGQASLLSIKQ